MYAGFWTIAIVVFLIIEAIVPGLISIWFAVGAVPALISALFGGPFWLQFVLFLVSSIIALVLTRPLAKKYSRIQPTNFDMVIGKNCVVTETIDNLRGTGAVSVGGKVWTARSLIEDDIIVEKTIAVVDKIDGVKLIIRRN